MWITQQKLTSYFLAITYSKNHQNMEVEKKKGNKWNFAFGIGIGFLLYKIVFDVLMPMFF